MSQRPDLWMPGARIHKVGTDGGSMTGGPPRAVWHTTENNPAKTTLWTLEDYLVRTRKTPQILVHPLTGEIVQFIAADRAGRALRNLPGGPQTNRDGDYCIQVEVIGRAIYPFTDGPMRGIAEIVKWMDSLGIPRVWPAGPPMSYPESFGDNGDRGAWSRGGHFGHSQVPENDHGDPGRVDIDKLTPGFTAPGRPVPVQQEEDWSEMATKAEMAEVMDARLKAFFNGPTPHGFVDHSYARREKESIGFHRDVWNQVQAIAKKLGADIVKPGQR